MLLQSNHVRVSGTMKQMRVYDVMNQVIADMIKTQKNITNSEKRIHSYRGTRKGMPDIAYGHLLLDILRTMEMLF